MSCFLHIFKAQNVFEIKLVEIEDYNSLVLIKTPQYLKWLLKGIFLTLKKCQFKLVSVRLNEKKLRTKSVLFMWQNKLNLKVNVSKKQSENPI